MQNDMKNRLVELIKQAKQSTKNANCDLERNMLFADSLIENGVVVLDTDVLLSEYRPLIKTIADMPLNEVIELIKAKQEGRVIVPPCKVGDTVYFTGYGVAEELTVKFVSAEIKEKSYDVYVKAYRHNGECETLSFDNFGKIVFLTREEAEKALKEGADNG